MKKIILLSICTILAFANDTDVLSNTKQQIIQLKQKQIEKKEHNNKYDWLSDITVNGSVSKDQEDIQSEDYYLSISQDIFKFGGISSQIDYAKELKKMEEIDLEISTKDDISTLYSLLLDIKLNEISLKQNTLNVQNSQIDINHKKSEYKAGELGISDLNEAIMTKNELKDTAKTLQLTKLTNINNIKKYTNKNYKNISIPNPKIMSKELFLQNSSAVNYAKADINVNSNLYKIKKSDYLPSVSANAKYGYANSDSTTGDDYYNYGVSVNVPLSFTSSSTIEQKKLDYLISKQELNDEISDTELIYDENILNIKNYEDRINLATEDIKLYDELISTNEEEYKAGYKTIDDVNTLKNSKKIRELDIQSYRLNIQKKIISLYYQM